MKASVVFQLIVFNSDHVLDAVLESVEQYGMVIAVEGPVAYYQKRGYVRSTDKTLSILKSHNVLALSGLWNEKDDMMRAAERWIPATATHVWMVDADEVWDCASIERTLQELEHNDYDSVSFLPHTFFGGLENILTGFEISMPWYRIQRWYEGAHWATHRPPTVSHRDGRPMRQHHHYNSPERFFHYSYVFPTQVKSKIAYYESWGAGVIPNYFRDVWLPWVRGGARKRKHVEQTYRGVHEWLPERRGDCFTKPFTGYHPDPIRKRYDALQARFNRELKELR